MKKNSRILQQITKNFRTFETNREFQSRLMQNAEEKCNILKEKIENLRQEIRELVSKEFHQERKLNTPVHCSKFA